jgi:hypothetical protein
MPMTTVNLVRGKKPDINHNFVPSGGKNGGPDTFQMEYNPRLESSTQAIVKTVALVKNVPATELSPLIDDVDPDALNTLLEEAKKNGNQVEVLFEYEGFEVEITTSNIYLTWS